ncbi:hypothetical protein [Cerasicoccus fimbriatus]|uniref:hypothetical protein n=1 Tax=Cerasicoccus fimbriatus TaxID=3014554 RepID=UPI0022B465E8|nr:hypothetical protein [Cerasicoccus sp. TK19100]
MIERQGSWQRSLAGYCLIATSTTLWLIAPLPWWIPETSFATKLLSGLLLISLAELSFHGGLQCLAPDEAEHFHRWNCLKRGFRRLMGTH